MKRLVISSNGLNRHGYRVMSAGGRFEAYSKNPVLLLGHMTYGLPIGRTEDLKKHSDGSISCIPVFDDDDDLGKAAKHKWENGFLFAASIGFKPLKFSSDTKDLLPGQNRETVTEWDLLEISLVSVPGNVDASAGLSSLSAYSDSAIPPISLTTLPKMEKIALSLGLGSDADETAIIAAITKLNGEVSTLGKARVDALLQEGKAKGLVTDANQENWRNLATLNYDQAAAIFKAAPDQDAEKEENQKIDPAKPGSTLMGQLSSGNPATEKKSVDDRAGWTFDEWSQKDSKGLNQMRKDDPKGYAQLAAAKYEAV